MQNAALFLHQIKLSSSQTNHIDILYFKNKDIRPLDNSFALMSNVCLCYLDINEYLFFE